MKGYGSSRSLVALSGMVLILLSGVFMSGCMPGLLNAAKTGNVEKVTKMLQGGAEVYTRSAMNWTALHFAAEGGHVAVVKRLLDSRADADARNSEGQTPLHLAVENGHAEVVRLLIERGADFEIRDKRGATPLDIAEETGNTAVAGILRTAKEEKDSHYVKAATPGSPGPALRSDVDELPVVKVATNKNAYAVVIGIEQYRQKLPRADFAIHDAETVTEYLTKVMGYPEENVVTLTNDKASMTDFIKYFEKWLPNNVEKDGKVFVYYSGHGAPNPKTGDAFLVPYDGDPSFINETGYPLKKLYESLGRLQAKEVVVALDACFSGGGGRSVLAEGARPIVISMKGYIIHPKIMVLSASGGDQISSTYKEKGHGLFTYFMLKGIRGAGDTDGDGDIEIEELYTYLKPQIERTARKLYNNEQTPHFVAPEKRQKVFLIERAR